MRDLLKAILKTGSGSLATVFFGMVTVKLIAWRLGPEALGSFSLTRQLIVAGSALFLTGGQTALVQGMSSRSGRDREVFTSTAFVLLCLGSVVIALIVGAFSTVVGPKIFPGMNPSGAVPLAAVGIGLAGPMAFVFGALNAAKRIGRLAFVQALNAAALALFVWWFVPTFRVDRPAMFAFVLAVSQVPGLVLGCAFLWRAGEGLWNISFSAAAANQFFRVAFATVVAAGMQAWNILVIRGSIVHRFGLGTAGVFDAGWSISMVYVMLILSSFSTYYLPTLAAAGGRAGKLIEDVLRTTLLLIVPLIAVVMAFRPVLLVMLYSERFLVASSLMHWMLIGDFFKVLSFVVAMPMLARADLKAFLAGEIGWNLVMFVGARAALRTHLGIESIGAVFAISYLLYLLYALAYCARRLDWHWPVELRPELLCGSVILATVSILTWSVRQVSWMPTVLTLTLAVAQVAFVIRRRAETSIPLPRRAEVRV